MDTHANKNQEHNRQSQTKQSTPQQYRKSPTFQFIDNRPEAKQQRKLIEMMNNSSQVKQLRKVQEMVDRFTSKQQHAIQKKENNTGLPDNLKTGIENLSGYSMDDVRVHYNSEQPAQLNAHAYAQGTDIHIGPGQEKHLPHEAWHVVQQKQGRVKPTMQMKDKVPVNDDTNLEKEADVMGEKARQMKQAKDQKALDDKTIENNILQAYTKGAYNLANGKRREIHVEKGSPKHITHPPAETKATRSVLHETMVVADNGKKLAARYDKESDGFRNTIGLSVSINMPFKDAGELSKKKGEIEKVAKQMEETSKSPINVVKVLWEDGRQKDSKLGIRTEVPFAELRKYAASDPGSSELFQHLTTQADNVWRKMGDDDMPFQDPNKQDLEVNQHLKILEDNDGGTGNLVSFSYNLVPDSTDNKFIQSICRAVYIAESQAIKMIRDEFGIRTYAIEPTTYYRGAEGADSGGDWTKYEDHADDHNKQIKEGASFAKAMDARNPALKVDYIPLKEPMPTSDGGRLKKVVELLEKYLKGPNPDTANFEESLKAALKEVDQSIWDGESLTRGAKWMARDQSTQEGIDTITGQINKKINTVLKYLFTQIMPKITNEHARLHPPQEK